MNENSRKKEIRIYCTRQTLGIKDLYAIIFTDGFSDCTLDSEDENKIRYGYTYQGRQGNNNPQKFLATAIEALLGAYYLNHNESMKEVEPVVRGWMEIIDG